MITGQSRGTRNENHGLVGARSCSRAMPKWGQWTLGQDRHDGWAHIG